MRRAAERMLLAGLCAAFAGCGGGIVSGTESRSNRPEASPPPTSASPDAARLRAATLRPQDFPRDWTKTVVTPPRLRCASDSPYDSGAASSASRLFEQGDSAIQQAVWVFRDARVAREVFAQAEVRSARSCLRRTVEEQAHRRRDGTVRALKVVDQQERVDSRHVRLAGEGHRDVETAMGTMDSIVRVVTDVDVTRVGRSVSLVVMMSTTGPFPDDTRRDLLSLVRERLAPFAGDPVA